MHGVPVGRLVNVANRMPTTSSARLLHEFAVIALDKAFSLVANESYIGSFFLQGSQYDTDSVQFCSIKLC